MFTTILIPLIGGLLVLLFGKYEQVRNLITIATSLLLLAAVIYCLTQGETLDNEFYLPFIIPNLQLSLYVSDEGTIFAIMVSILWILANIYAIGYMKRSGDNNQQKFFFFFTISIGFTLGIAFAHNLLTIFLFYELLTLSTYPLIVHSGDAQAIKSGRIYLIFLLGSSILLLFPAIIITYNLSEQVDFGSMRQISYVITDNTLCSILFVMFIYGVGKAALMPMHHWLTAAMVAPTPVSALLHAVAVVKSGVFIIMKINYQVFGIEWVRNQSWLIYVAGCTIIIGSLHALKTNSLKERLAYSTISQLSYIILLATITDNIMTPIIYMLLHAFAKITLFFAAGSIYIKTKIQAIDRLHGIGKSMPWTMTCFSIAALSMIGLPFTGLFWGKVMLLSHAFKSITPIFIIVVITISTMLNTLYFLPIIYDAFFRSNEKTYSEINFAMRIPMIITTCFCLCAFWIYLI